MSNMRISLVLVLVAFACLGAIAETTTSVPIIVVENGYSMGYNLDTSEMGSAFDLAVDFGVSDAIQVQAIIIQGDATNVDNYRLLGLAYAVTPRIGVTTLMGLDTTASESVVGLGLYSNLLTRTVVGSLQTALKLKLDYIAPISSYDKGLLRIGLVAAVGM